MTFQEKGTIDRPADLIQKGEKKKKKGNSDRTGGRVTGKKKSDHSRKGGKEEEVNPCRRREKGAFSYKEFSDEILRGKRKERKRPDTRKKEFLAGFLLLNGLSHAHR